MISNVWIIGIFVEPPFRVHYENTHTHSVEYFVPSRHLWTGLECVSDPPHTPLNGITLNRCCWQFPLCHHVMLRVQSYTSVSQQASLCVWIFCPYIQNSTVCAFVCVCVWAHSVATLVFNICFAIWTHRNLWGMNSLKWWKRFTGVLPPAGSTEAIYCGFFCLCTSS